MPQLRNFGAAYPSLTEIFDSCRVLINDTFKGTTQTWGEGRVFTTSVANMWQPAITHLNLACQALQRDLEKFGVKTTKEEIFLANLYPINGPLGVGVPDPSVQVYLDFNGFWDGSVLHGGPPSPARPNGDPSLPFDMLVPLKVWERDTGSGTNYIEIASAPDGLPSMFQSFSLGMWEWRAAGTSNSGDALYFNGSIVPKDVRIKYRASILPKFPVTLDPNLFSSTFVPFADTQDALAYRTAYIFCAARLPAGGANELLAQYNDMVGIIANRTVKQMQRTKYSRRPAVGDWFGSLDSGWG